MIFPEQLIDNRYLAKSLLNRGGMGEVWKCQDTILGRDVILKTVTPELAATRPEHKSIFIDEAKIGAFLLTRYLKFGIMQHT